MGLGFYSGCNGEFGFVRRSVGGQRFGTNHSPIPRQHVDSTAIAKVGYRKRRHILEIEFANGAIYRYLDLPSSVYRNLMSAESKARFYDLNIKGKYRSVHVRPRIKHKSAN